MTTILYIDGFNLYYSALKGTRFRWLDPIALAARAFPKNRITATKFFSAKVSALPHNPHQPTRQRAYWRALATLPAVTIIEGDFRTRKVRAKVVSPPPPTVEVYHYVEPTHERSTTAHPQGLPRHLQQARLLVGPVPPHAQPSGLPKTVVSSVRDT